MNERDLFELNFFYLELNFSRSKTTGIYKDDHVQSMWIGWAAAKGVPFN